MKKTHLQLRTLFFQYKTSSFVMVDHIENVKNEGGLHIFYSHYHLFIPREEEIFELKRKYGVFSRKCSEL